MIDDELLEKLNWQIANEMGSAVLYKNMQFYFDKLGMKNTAEYYYKQSVGEYQHAYGIAKFISDRDCIADITVKMFPILDRNIEGIIKQTLDHERYVTKALHEVSELACELEEPLVKEFIRKYIEEQIEEEAVSQMLVDTYSLTSDKLLFDNRVKELI